jgi:hypothetical protein
MTAIENKLTPVTEKEGKSECCTLGQIRHYFRH